MYILLVEVLLPNYIKSNFYSYVFIYPEESHENYLEFKDESPETLIHQFIDDMTEKYGEYKKISIRKD